MRVAAVQMTATADKDRNLEAAGRLIDGAAEEGAALVVLPEMFNLMGSAETLRAGAEPIEGPTLDWAREAARKHRIWLLAGSITEQLADDEKHANTSCLLNPEG